MGVDMKTLLTDRAIKALPAKDKPYERMDGKGNAMGVRVTPNGAKSFIVCTRIGGVPTRRVLGKVGAMKLAAARAAPREYLIKLKDGDPARAAKQAKAAALEALRIEAANTVEAALESYFSHKSNLRSAPATKRDMLRELAPWMGRPLASVTERDVLDLVNAIKARGHRRAANTALIRVKAFFNWIADTRGFGIEQSPAARLKAHALIGKIEPRDRVLNDAELRAYWNAAVKLGYPGGAFLQLLALTGLRRNEASEASWREIELDRRLWIIPAKRMGKTKRPHAFPLTPAMIALLEGLPRFQGGDFVFTTTAGRAAIAGMDDLKRRLDARMRAELGQLDHFTFHDVRRTVRSQLHLAYGFKKAATGI